jgi:hypothetical protein
MATDEVDRPIYNPLTSRFPAPIARIDWAFRWIAYYASNVAAFKVLEYAGKLTVVVALCAWLADCHERREAAIRTAWSVVNAKGGGRRENLQYLSGHSVDLKGLYGAGGYFAGIVLTENDDLSWSDLTDSNFEGSTLASIKLNGAHLSGVRFKNADLRKAHFNAAHFEPVPPDFDKADIEGAEFFGVTGLGYQSYLAIYRAKNWEKANYDEGVKRLIECAATGNKDKSCPTGVPEILGGGNMVENVLFVQRLLYNISCELQDAVVGIKQDNAMVGRTKTFIDSWAVQMTLTLSIGAQTGIAQATRIDKIGEYYLVSELVKLKACPRPASPPNDNLLLQSDLKLKDWLVAGMIASETRETSVFAGALVRDTVHQTALEHEIKFVVVADNGPNPVFRLKAASDDPAAPVTSSTDGPKMYDLLITIAPLQSLTKKQPR